MWLIIRNSGGMFHYAALRTLDWTNDIIKTYNPTRSSPRYFPGVIGADFKQFTSVLKWRGNTFTKKHNTGLLARQVKNLSPCHAKQYL